MLVGLALIFPWILVRDISALERLSTLCLVFALLIFGVLVANAAQCEIDASAQLVVTDAYAVFSGLPTISWCWSLQFNALPIYRTLPDGPQSRLSQIHRVSLCSVAILFCFYGVQGIAVYAVWGARINADFITNLDAHDANYTFFLSAWLSTLTQLLISLACFFSIPIFAFESRTNLHSLLRSAKSTCCRGTGSAAAMNVQTPALLSSHEHGNAPVVSPAEDVYRINSLSKDYCDVELEVAREGGVAEEGETCLSRWLEGSFILLSAALVALLISNLNLCLSLCGATYGVYISYFLPSGVYIAAVNRFDARQLERYDVVLKYIAVFSIAYGSVVCVAGITTSLL